MAWDRQCDSPVRCCGRTAVFQAIRVQATSMAASREVGGQVNGDVVTLTLSSEICPDRNGQGRQHSTGYVIDPPRFRSAESRGYRTQPRAQLTAPRRGYEPRAKAWVHFSRTSRATTIRECITQSVYTYSRHTARVRRESAQRVDWVQLPEAAYAGNPTDCDRHYDGPDHRVRANRGEQAWRNSSRV